MSHDIQNQIAFPGLELPQQVEPLPPSATYDPSKARHIGAAAAAESVQRLSDIAEMRGSDLGAEQTGFKPEIVANATGAVDPSYHPKPPKGRKRAVGGQRPDTSDDPRLEGTTHEQVYPPAAEVVARFDDGEQAKINARYRHLWAKDIK